MRVFRIELLPARYGDALWIEYGEPPHLHHVLIDGGTAGTRKDIQQRLRGVGELDLCMVSHIDRDHIEGLLGLLEQDEPGFRTRDFWFNGWPHLEETDETYGAVQAERLTAAIVKHDIPWNRDFRGCAVVVPDAGPLPVRTLPGGMRLTLLSPTRAKLEALRPKWEKEVQAANLDPGFGLEAQDESGPDESFGGGDLPDVGALAATPFVEDRAEANGSSIAVLAEYGGKRALLAADAHPSVLVSAIKRLSPSNPLNIDLFKVAHHGSEHNTSRELLDLLQCPRYAFSTNGRVFEHPSDPAVARVIRHGGPNPTLIFNYRTSRNAVWDPLSSAHGYATVYPSSAASGVNVSV